MSTSLQDLSIDTIRVLSMDAVQKANAGHPGTAMALAPVAYTIYREYLRVNPVATDWPDRDRFVLSAGHACILQYTTLHLTGHDLPMSELERFRQWDSRTPGHPEHFLTPGIETTTGPLGQGIASAVGMAMAERFLGQRYNRPGHTVVDHHVYGICSDGDLMEGVSAEAASLAGAFGLGKLIFVYDDNRITIDGTTALSFDLEDKAARFESYGWHVEHVADVNDVEAIRAALDAAKAEIARPSLIIARTHIAYPAPHAQDTAKAHGAPLGEAEVRATKEVLGWDPDATFVVPDGVYEHMSLAEPRRDPRSRMAWPFRRLERGLPGSGSRLGPRVRGRASSRLGRCPAAVRSVRQAEARHARSRGEGHGGVQAVHADHGGRCSRSRRVDEDGLRRRRSLRADLRRTEYPVRHP